MCESEFVCVCVRRDASERRRRRGDYVYGKGEYAFVRYILCE